MASRLVSGGGAGRLPGEAGEGPGAGRSPARQPGGSLARLGTDYIDLYWLHNSGQHTPIEETIATLNDLVRDGKIRYTGLSDTPAWAVARTAVIADLRGWAPISSNRLIFLLRAAVQQRRSRHVCRRLPSGSARRAPESTARRRRPS